MTIAQAIDESAWGQSTLATRDNNLFGIKGTGPAGSDALPTQEYQNGQWVTITAQFRIYNDIAESINDHGQLLATSGYYTAAMAARNAPNTFAQALTGVYATDPSYGTNLISLMRRYNLYRFDPGAQSARAQAAAAAQAPTAQSPTAQPPTAQPPTAAATDRAVTGRPAVCRPVSSRGRWCSDRAADGPASRVRPDEHAPASGHTRVDRPGRHQCPPRPRPPERTPSARPAQGDAARAGSVPAASGPRRLRRPLRRIRSRRRNLPHHRRRQVGPRRRQRPRVRRPSLVLSRRPRARRRIRRRSCGRRSDTTVVTELAAVFRPTAAAGQQARTASAGQQARAASA